MFGIRLTVAYDGTGFEGWQRQPGARTIQRSLEEAVEALAGAPCRIRGASRTDSGVHAYGQVAAFDSPREIPPFGWERGLNTTLPPEISVRRAEPCPIGYDPRHDARAKRYRYLVHLGAAPDPMLRLYAWHLGPRRARPLSGRPTRASEWLDVEGMRRAAALLEGRHDFRAFRSSRDARPNTVRTIESVRVIPSFTEREDLLAIEVRGDAFLHRMVRIIAGTLVDVGRERLRPDDVSALLESGERAGGGPTAPAHGLYLLEVELGREPPGAGRRTPDADGEGARPRGRGPGGREGGG